MSFGLIFRNSLAGFAVALSQAGGEELRGLPNLAERSAGHWDFYAEALGWYASEQSSAVWADVIEIGNNTSSFTPQDLDFDWDFGFRAGAGYQFDADSWDTQVYWTWFRTEAKDRREVHPEFLPLLGPTAEIHPEFFAADLSGDSSESAAIRWSVLMNMFDGELGRRYWISKGLSLRPFVGLKGGWINQSVDVGYGNLIVADAPTEISARERLKNDFWGIGPAGGVGTKWKLRDFCGHYPSIFGDFSLATLWGTWTTQDDYRDSSGKNIVLRQGNTTLGALILRGIVGVGWDVEWGKSRFAARLGYETQYWLNQLRVATSQLVRLHGDLTLQGVAFKGQFDF